MGARGPPPKPSALRLLTNPDAKRKLNDREPQPKKRPPKMPSYLDDAGRAKWRELCKKLLELGVLTEIDGDALGRYCAVWAEWISVARDYERFGRYQACESGYVQEHPAYTSWKKLAMDLEKLGAVLGLSPSSRTRVRVEQPKKKAGDWEQL